jgi:Sulfotransferase domain
MELVSAMTWRKSVPGPLIRVGRSLTVKAGGASAGLRARPDFILVGAQRCGTTSLFRALMAHPQILRPVFHKGVNYFDMNYFRGERWYRGHFPLVAVARARTANHGPPRVFDASGYYMYHPTAPERIAKDLPAVKLIAMLRDPVERAYSAYQHEFARGFEWEAFERALDLEGERLVGEIDRMRSDQTYESFAHRHHSYTRRGHYAEQLAVFLKLFGPEQLLVIDSEAFFTDPAAEYKRIVDFLDVEPFQPARFDRYNARPRAAMSSQTRSRLEGHFGPHDDHLEDLLHRRPAWRT